MKSLIYYLLHPMPWLVMGFFVLAYCWRHWGRGRRRAALALWLLVFYATTTPFVPRLLIAQLEDRHPPLSLQSLDTAQTYHIIVLGGGHGYDDRLPANTLLENAALGRLVEGIRLYRQLSHSRLITSGYSASDRQTHAEVLREAALLLGVDSTRVYAQREPANTRQEAQTYVGRFGTDTPLIICTSATHMPRAMRWFRHHGVQQPIASPTNHHVKRQDRLSWRSLLPRSNYWDQLAQVAHEYAGLVELKLREGF